MLLAIMVHWVLLLAVSTVKSSLLHGPFLLFLQVYHLQNYLSYFIEHVVFLGAISTGQVRVHGWIG